MAIREIKEKSTLRLTLDEGMVDGKQKMKTKSYSKVKPEANSENIYRTGVILGSFQEKEVLDISRVDVVSLIEE